MCMTRGCAARCGREEVSDMAKFKISYVYEVSAMTQAEAKMTMATARQNGTDEELFTYVSVRKVEQQGLMSQVVSQLVG